MKDPAYDGQGSVTANTWYNGMVTDVYQYDPYGRMELGGEGHTDFYGCRAESYKPNTGLEYLRARYYNADKGRFFREDTYLGDITDPLTLNRYAYVKNSPLNYVDPSGHDAYIYEKDGNYYIEPDNKWYNISENVVGLIPFGDTFARWLDETIYGWDYIEDDTDMWTAVGAGVTVIGLCETIENHSEITSTAMRSAKITKVAGAAGTIITFITFGGTFIDNGPKISQATVALYREYLSAIPDKEILEQRYRLLYLLVGIAMEKGAITYCTEKWYDEDAFLIVPGSTQISDQDKFQEAMDEIGYTPEDVIEWFPVNEKR